MAGSSSPATRSSNGLDLTGADQQTQNAFNDIYDKLDKIANTTVGVNPTITFTRLPAGPGMGAVVNDMYDKLEAITTVRATASPVVAFPFSRMPVASSLPPSVARATNDVYNKLAILVTAK